MSTDPVILTVIPHPHVRIDPNVLGGSPYVVGSRVPVRRIYSFHVSGVSVEGIFRRYPQLGPAKVLDALAFAYDNRAVIDADIEREKALVAGGRPRA